MGVFFLMKKINEGIFWGIVTLQGGFKNIKYMYTADYWNYQFAQLDFNMSHCIYVVFHVILSSRNQSMSFQRNICMAIFWENCETSLLLNKTLIIFIGSSN